FGVAILTGLVRPGQAGDAPAGGGRVEGALGGRRGGRRRAVAGPGRAAPGPAAVAGPATHVPGLFYVIALNLIVAHDAALAGKTFALVVYNAIWFALPILALVACISDPGAARGLVAAVDGWARGHARTILLVASFGVGAA